MTKKLNFLAATTLLGGSLLFTSTPVWAQIQPQSPISSVSNTSSYNWAGYVAANGSYTSITGTWIIPQVTSGNSLSADATWVGIGGVGSTDLIQAGTMNSSGQSQAWFETLPQAISPISLPVKAGDSITVLLDQRSAGVWNISFNDNTTGQNYQTSVNYNSSLSSAEWIEEMPASNFGFIPLDNFGTVQFTNSSTIQNGQPTTITGANAQMMTMVNAGRENLASPSALGADGGSFTVTRSGASSASSVGPGYVRRRWSHVSRDIQGYTPPAQGSTRILRFYRDGFQTLFFQFR